MRIRTYGTSGPPVIVLHGGPAAVGSAAPLAQALADSYRIYEPWQRGSGDRPLTVAQHVADLHELVEACITDTKPAVIGESWGAMLALAYAAAHPDAAGPLVLIGCGTFDKASRAQLTRTREERMDHQLREQLGRLDEESPDPAKRLKRWRELTEPLDDFAPLAVTTEQQDILEPFDFQAHTETWNDMLRLEEEGVYPAAFRVIRSPVLMLHGDYDPHPGHLILASLIPHIPQIEYHELSRCGHRPWLERFAREAFWAVLRRWLGGDGWIVDGGEMTNNQ